MENSVAPGLDAGLIRRLEASEIEVLRMDASIFEQLAQPLIDTENFDEKYRQAEAGTIGFVIALEHWTEHDFIWLVVQNDNLLSLMIFMNN